MISVGRLRIVMWKRYKPQVRASLLRQAGASTAQVQALRDRDWFALSRWVRKGIKKIQKKEKGTHAPRNNTTTI